MQLKQLEPGLFVSPQISAEDIPAIVAQGVKAIFGPGTNIPDAAENILNLIRATRQPEAAE